MNPDETAGNKLGVDQMIWYRVGGIAAVLLAVGYTIIVPLFFHVGAPLTLEMPGSSIFQGKQAFGGLLLRCR